MSRKNNNVINIVIAILSVLLVVAVIGFVFKFTNGLNEDLKTFYIEHNGKQIVATDSQMTFDVESEHRFDCKYLSTPDEDNLFTVEVVPNATEKNDFNFTIDDVLYKWSELKDLTACFTINKQHNYFIITFPADFSMQSVLNSLYPEKEVVISDTLSLYQYYYTLHVSSYNGKINYYIDFNVVNESKGDIIANYDKKIEELENNIDDLGLQITTLKNEKATLNNEIGNLENNIAELQESINDKNSEIATLNTKIKTLENEKETLISENNDNSEKISSLNSQITSLNNQISELQNSITDKESEIKDLQLQVKTLTDEKTALQENIEYYENFVSKYEDDETAVVTIEVDGSVYAMFTMAKGSTMFDIQIPDSNDYVFLNWLKDGAIVELDIYTITENVTFVADLDYGHVINFVVDGLIYYSNYRFLGEQVIAPGNPEKEGYTFLGWFDSNGSKIDFSHYLCHGQEDFFARYEAISVRVLHVFQYNESFLYDDSSQIGFLPEEGLICVDSPSTGFEFTLNDGYKFTGYYFLDSDIESPLIVSVNGNVISYTLNFVPTEEITITLVIQVVDV